MRAIITSRAQKLGALIYQHYSGANIIPRMENRMIIGFQITEALARRANGDALADIGRSYGVSHSTISRL